MSESEYTTIVEAIETKSKHLNPIAAVLKGKKGSALECLVKACNCKLNKRHGYITDQAGRVIKISQLFEYMGIITTSGVRCPECLEPVSYDLLFYHWDDHGFKIEKIFDLFRRNFEQWSYRDSKFYWQGSVIEI